MTEMYKTKNDLNPSFMQETFYENVSNYRVRSVSYGTKGTRFKRSITLANGTTNIGNSRHPERGQVVQIAPGLESKRGPQEI